MGAERFSEEYTLATTVKETFSAAVESALYYYGHAGYTGSLAEKDSYVELLLPEGVDLYQADRDFGAYPFVLTEWMLSMPSYQIDQAYSAYDDKWGPALALVSHDKTKVIFCGYASS